MGVDVHRGARVAGLAHGGQVLITEPTRTLLSAHVAVTDLGQHRVKDFEGFVRVLQLGDASFAPLRTPGAVDLPIPATTFLGRERELLEAVSLWYEREPRVVSVVGPGGTGKTRFTLELARLLAEEADGGTVFVPLAPLRDAALLLPSVADLLGATGAGTPCRAHTRRAPRRRARGRREGDPDPETEAPRTVVASVPPPACTKRAVRLTDPGAIAERLGPPQEAVRRLQRRAFLRQLDLDDAEIRERLLRGHLTSARGRRVRRLKDARSLDEDQTEP